MSASMKDQDVLVDDTEYKDADDDFLDVPELSMPSTLPSNYEMRVETDILEPVVFSQDFCRFTLQKKGFLSHQSKISFAVNPADGVINDGGFFPLNIGVNSLISRCVLKSGQKTIAETESFAQLQAYRSTFITPENNYDREKYTTGRLIILNGEYAFALADNPNNNAPHYGVRTGMELDTTPVVNSRKLQPFALIDGTNADRRAEPPVFSIYLADLFDVFKGYDLPMFMIDDEVHIELHFSPLLNNQANGSSRVSVQAGDAGGQVYNLVQDEVRMIYDTIFYDGETMNKWRQSKESKGGVVLDYVDYRLNTSVRPQVDWNNGIRQNIGGAGRMVDKVIYLLNDGNGRNNSDTWLVNGYYGIAPPITPPGLGAVKEIECEVNLYYNDRYEFSADRNNLAVINSTTATAEGGLAPQLSKQFYGNEGIPTITTSAIEGRVQQASFASAFFVNSIKLKRGERVNNQGLELYYSNSIGAPGNRNLYVWLALKKTAVIKDGRFDCYFQ